MANFVDYSYSSDSGESDYTGKPHCLDLSYTMVNSPNLSQNLEVITSQNGDKEKNATYYESLILRHNRLVYIPDVVALFTQLKVLDVSGNSLTSLPDSILLLKNLISLVVKNNLLTNDGIPKDLGQCKSIKEVNPLILFLFICYFSSM